MVRCVRPVSNDEGERLARICRYPTDAYELHQAQGIPASAPGSAAPYIVDMVGYSPDWVRTPIREFNLHWFRMLKPNWKVGGELEVHAGTEGPTAGARNPSAGRPRPAVLPAVPRPPP